jgi:hypothetical protein
VEIEEIMVLVAMNISAHGIIPCMKIVNNDNIIMLECIIVDYIPFESILLLILVHYVGVSLLHQQALYDTDHSMSYRYYKNEYLGLHCYCICA